MKKPAFYSSANAMGDLIAATPTIKRLAQTYNQKITVISNHPYLFSNCPYVENSFHFSERSEDDLRQEYDLHKTFFLLGKQDVYGVEFKHAMCDIRQYHAKDLGFMLTPDEMTCEYFPKESEECLRFFNLPEKYVVIHPSQSWESRTWSKKNWQSLCNDLKELGINVVSIGKDTTEGNTKKPIYKLDNCIDLSNLTSIDQSWHILNNSVCVVTMDSGILHLAGTTDTFIVQLGSSIKPEYRAPWRNSTQDYKYKYIVGSCKLHCASDLRYSLRDWGGIQNVTLIGTCLEKKSTFECNPEYQPVLEEVKNIWENFDNTILEKPTKEVIETNTLVTIQPVALGDNIGAMSVIEKYRKITGKKITVISEFADILTKSYPELTILQKNRIRVDFSPIDGTWTITTLNNEVTRFTENIVTTYKFDVPLLEGFAKDFGITDISDIKIKVDNPGKERPIKGKYVCLGVHSTSQCKYWNYPGGWDELCKYFRKMNITPVCVEKHETFGVQGNFNELPSKALKKIGLPFDEVLNYISHAEMFIGISSGLSWVAQGLGVPTVIISNVTSKDNEFVDDKTLRIYDESVCHGCFHKYPFNAGDWFWCPVYRDDNDRRFICSKAITPERVIKEIEEFHQFNN